MAQIDINRISKIVKTRNYIHDKVETTYTVFEKGGNKYFQIDTYGTSMREVPGKISQSFQIDESAAGYLIDLIIKELNLEIK